MSDAINALTVGSTDPAIVNVKTTSLILSDTAKTVSRNLGSICLSKNTYTK